MWTGQIYDSLKNNKIYFLQPQREMEENENCNSLNQKNSTDTCLHTLQIAPLQTPSYNKDAWLAEYILVQGHTEQ